MQVDEPMRQEITPKNILMIGPTGVGKTEIARRLARLAQAPFVKVEATKFTEVGYVGREVDSIIKELADVAVKMTREQELARVRDGAREAAVERVLDALLPKPRMLGFSTDEPYAAARYRNATEAARHAHARRRSMNARSRSKCARCRWAWKSWRHPAWRRCSSSCSPCCPNLGGNRTRTRRVKVREALKLMIEEEAAKLINEEELKARALTNAEQNGIVFIDEIDKITRRQETHRCRRVTRGRAARPAAAGRRLHASTPSTARSRPITCCSSPRGHSICPSPSDLIPELQGRFPIRVELDSLKVEDFVRILTEPDASLTAQYRALLGTEQVALEFTPDGVRRIAEIACQVNERTENIGARRLHTVMERLLETDILRCRPAR